MANVSRGQCQVQYAVVGRHDPSMLFTTVSRFYPSDLAFFSVQYTAYVLTPDVSYILKLVLITAEVLSGCTAQTILLQIPRTGADHILVRY